MAAPNLPEQRAVSAREAYLRRREEAAIAVQLAWRRRSMRLYLSRRFEVCLQPGRNLVAYLLAPSLLYLRALAGESYWGPQEDWVPARTVVVVYPRVDR